MPYPYKYESIVKTWQWVVTVIVIIILIVIGATAIGFPSVSTPLITYVIMNECVGFVGPMILRQELLIPATTTPEEINADDIPF